MTYPPRSTRPGFLPGANVLVTEGPIAGCVGRVVRPSGIAHVFGEAHNCVEVAVCRRRFTLPEAFLRATTAKTGATL